MKSYFAGVLTVLILLGVAGVGYFVGKGTFEKGNSPTQPQGPSNQEVRAVPSTNPQATPAADNSVQVKTQILAALASKSYDKLSAYMANSVSVRKEATSCCGILTKEEAVAELSYLKAGGESWVFDDTNAKIIKIKKDDPANYGGSAIVGVSANNYAVAFFLGADGKINKISMSVDFNLIGN